MKEKNKHTFVILAYKESAYLEDCILSLKKQTVKSNILMSTSTPNKHIESVSRKHGIRLCVGSGTGITNDWNNAYGLCKTRFLTLAHQDDVYLPAYTEDCLRYAVKGKSLVVFTNYVELLGKKRTRKRGINLIVKRWMLWPFVFGPRIGSRFIKKLVLAFGNPICCPSVLYDVENVGNNFQFDVGLSYDMDWEAWFQLSQKKGDFVYINEILMYHRIHRQSETFKQINSNNRATEERLMLKRIWPDWMVKILLRLYFVSHKANRSMKNG